MSDVKIISGTRLASVHFETPTTPVAGGFKVFSRRIKMCQKLPTDVDICSVDDIDFVFLVKRPDENSLSSKNKSSRGHQCMTGLERSRLEYLEALKSEYKIIYKRVEGRTHDFYLIHLSYYHLGLLAEILRYQWQIKTSDPNKKRVFKHLTFFRWMNSDADNEEFHNCSKRSDFPPRYRLDLAYQFLLKASVHIGHPFFNGNDGCLEGVTKRPVFFNVMSVLSEKLFDDWMVLHSPLTQKYVKWNFRNCAPFCAALVDCFQSTTGDDRPTDSSAFNPQTESLREFLCRYCTLKTAFLKHFYPRSDGEKVAGAELKHIIPVHQIREYAGEKIGFYFAWAELLTMSMFFPAVIGALLFIIQAAYYTFDSLTNFNNLDESDRLTTGALIQHILVRSCDNYGTPVFAVMMIVWGTIFHESWCRREAWYRYLWNVETLEVEQLEHSSHLHSQQQCCLLRYFRYTCTTFVILGFIGLVFGSVYVVNVLHVFSFYFCPTLIIPENIVSDEIEIEEYRNATNHSIPIVVASYSNATAEALPIATSDSTVLCNLFGLTEASVNSLSISILDAVFTNVAYKLTDWEGHDTEGRYTAALTFKLFVFRFFNFNSVLFFLAFGSNVLSLNFLSSLIPGGKPFTGILGDVNSCGNQPCLLKLTKQMLSILITERLFDMFIGLTNPWIYSLRERLLGKFNVFEKNNESLPGDEEDAPMTAKTIPPSDISAHVLTELEEQSKMIHLSPLGRQQFTADEFTERLIVFGALLMFSVALPPAAALVLPFLRVDMTMDIRRMVTRYKRPIPHRANGIGVWDKFVNFLTYFAIITNPLVIILTSTWGSQFDVWSKFWVFIAFEHITIAVRAIIAIAIPDIPSALEREKLRRMIVRHELLDETVIDNSML